MKDCNVMYGYIIVEKIILKLWFCKALTFIVFYVTESSHFGLPFGLLGLQMMGNRFSEHSSKERYCT